MKESRARRNGWWWAAAWLGLIVLGVDFYNWNKTPVLWLGLPTWLWQLLAVVLLVALLYGILSRAAWEEE